MAIKCDQCGLVAPNEKVMHAYWPGASSQAQHFCPACWRQRQKRTHRLEGQFVALVIVVLVAGAALAPVEHGGGLGRVALMILLVNAAAVVLHELGHAVAAWAFGHRVFEFSIGMGLELWRRRLGHTDVKLHLMPTCGHVMHGSRSLRFSRLAHFVITAAGPAVNVGLAVLGYVMIDGSVFPTQDMMLAHAGDAAPLLAQSNPFETVPAPPVPVDSISIWHIVFGVNALIAALNLIPLSLRSDASGIGGGYIANDGMSMLTMLLSRGKVFEHLLAASVARQVDDLIELGENDAALERARTSVERFPKIVWLRLMLAQTLNRFERYAEARDIVGPILADPPDKEARIVAAYVSASVELDDPDGDVQKADRLTEEIAQAHPGSVEIQVARARALVANGWVAKGAEAMTTMLGAFGEDEKAAASCCCFLAVAELEQSDIEEASRYVDLARSLDAKCRYLPRVSEAVAARAERSQ